MKLAKHVVWVIFEKILLIRRKKLKMTKNFEYVKFENPPEKEEVLALQTTSHTYK